MNHKKAPNVDLEVYLVSDTENVSKEMMSKGFDKLDNLYKEEKSSKFILHCIRAFLPISEKTEVVQKFSEKQLKNTFCSITDRRMNDFCTSINGYVNKKGVKVTPKSPIIAYSGKETQTIMSMEGILIFNEWVKIKAITDKQIRLVVQQEFEKSAGYYKPKSGFGKMAVSPVSDMISSSSLENLQKLKEAQLK